MTTSTAIQEQVTELVREFAQKLSNEKGITLEEALRLITRHGQVTHAMTEGWIKTASDLANHMNGVDGTEFDRFVAGLLVPVKRLLGATTTDAEACSQIINARMTLGQRLSSIAS